MQLWAIKTEEKNGTGRGERTKGEGEESRTEGRHKIEKGEENGGGGT